jgi:adenylate cyclase
MRWTPESELAEALRLAHFAVDLDPNDGGSHKVMGMVLFLQGQDEESREHLERAEALNPIDADIIAHAALFRAYTGDAAAALDRMARAMELNPYHPDWYWAAMGTAAFAAGDEETALRAFRRRQDQDRLVCAYIAACLAGLGRTEEAGRQRERCLELCRSEGHSAALLLREEAGLYRRTADRGRFLDRLCRAGFEVTCD